MANSFVQVPPDSTGKKLDTEQLVVGANTVERERLQVAGAAGVAIAVVTNTTPGAGDYGLVVRPQVTPVTDNGGTLTVDDGGGSLTVDGSVGITGALPAGTNNIGDVDVLTMPGTAVEDVAAVGGETGLYVLGVRNDAAAARTSADGDFGSLAIDSAGRVGIADLGGVISVDDNGTTLSVDDGGGVLSVDDAGGSLTVDGAVSVTGSLPAGTNNIGDVDILSIAAGSTKIGSVNRELEPAIAGTVTAVKFASVEVSASGDNTIVAAVASKKIRVLAVAIVAAAAVSTRWKSGAATNLSGPMAMAANGGYSANGDSGLFETAVNTALVLNLSSAVAVAGHITYIEV